MLSVTGAQESLRWCVALSSITQITFSIPCIFSLFAQMIAIQQMLRRRDGAY